MHLSIISCHTQQISLVIGITSYLLHHSYILTLMDLLLLPYSTCVTVSTEIVTNTCSFLLSNDSYWNKISRSLLRNADKPMIQSDSATQGKIHHGLSQSYVNACCHQTRDAQCDPACPRVTCSFHHSSNGPYPAVTNSGIYPSQVTNEFWTSHLHLRSLQELWLSYRAVDQATWLSWCYGCGAEHMPLKEENSLRLKKL